MDLFIFVELFLVLFKVLFSSAQFDYFNNNYPSGNNEEVYHHNYGNVIYDKINQPYLIFNQNYEGLDYLNPTATASDQRPAPLELDTTGKKTIISQFLRPNFYPNFDHDVNNFKNNLVCYYVPRYPGITDGMQILPPLVPSYYYSSIPQKNLVCKEKPIQPLLDNSGQYSSSHENILPPISMLNKKLSDIKQYLSSGNISNNNPDGGTKNNFNLQKCDILCKCRNIAKKSSSLPENDMKTENLETPPQLEKKEKQ